MALGNLTAVERASGTHKGLFSQGFVIGSVGLQCHLPHEVGHHAIAGHWLHESERGFVDAQLGPSTEQDRRRTQSGNRSAIEPVFTDVGAQQFIRGLYLRTL